MDCFTSESEAYAWAAGLFDGEGSIQFTASKGRTTRKLQMGMTDEDLVRRFHEVVRVGYVCYRDRGEDNRKPEWVWHCGRWEDIRPLLSRLLPYFGSRRRAKAAELLANPAAYNRSGTTHCRNGHPRTEENTLVTRDRGNGRIRRRCLPCRRAYEREHYAAKKAR